jgi:hypothetical protein
VYQPKETKNAKSNMRDITKTNIPVIFSGVKRVPSDKIAS